MIYRQTGRMTESSEARASGEVGARAEPRPSAEWSDRAVKQARTRMRVAGRASSSKLLSRGLLSIETSGLVSNSGLALLRRRVIKVSGAVQVDAQSSGRHHAPLHPAAIFTTRKRRQRTTCRAISGSVMTAHPSTARVRACGREMRACGERAAALGRRSAWCGSCAPGSGTRGAPPGAASLHRSSLC